jgi:hypothetical protein
MLNFEFLSREDLTSTFPSEESCLKHLEKLRWNNEIVSPFDKNSKVYACKNNKFRCRNSGNYFNVKTNTIFHNSRIPLQKWFIAIWIISNGKRGISSVALGLEIGVTQKTSWYMLQRIKKYIDQANGIEKPKSKSKKKITVVQKPKPSPKNNAEIPLKQLVSIEDATPKDQFKMSDWLLLLKNK